MPGFGRAVVDTVGRSIQVSADGHPETKAAGLTVDWGTVAAQTGSDVTWLDGVTIRVGEKGLRYGQVLALITATGYYGPFDPAAGDGRQTLARDKAYIVNESMRQDDRASDHPPALYGGLCYQGRIIQAGTGTASLAAGPTLAALQAAFPRLALVTE
jgi:hypothetical protein